MFRTIGLPLDVVSKVTKGSSIEKISGAQIQLNSLCHRGENNEIWNEGSEELEEHGPYLVW